MTKKNAISLRLCHATVILAFHHCTGSQQSASRGHVGAFYRIAPCLIKNISRNMEAVILKPEMYSTKERKWHPSCSCHDNSYAACPVLIMTKIPRFYLKQGSSTPNNLMRRVKTIWKPCGMVNISKTKKDIPSVANGAIWFFKERDWSQVCCHGNNIVGVILFLL